MILGNLQYPSRYIGLGRGVKRGLEYLSEHEHELSDLSPGRHTIDGDDIFFEVAEIITTEPDKKLFESHKNYLDIHITLSGEEWFGHAMAADIHEVTPYNPENDTAYYSGEGLYLQAPPGHFILFMPEDAHKPGVYFQNQGTVRKIILKVRI